MPSFVVSDHVLDVRVGVATAEAETAESAETTVVVVKACP